MFTVEVYDKNTAKQHFFERNGIATLDKCISCITKERLNGEYELELKYMLSHKKSAYLKKWNIIKAGGQLFRIYTVKNDVINDVTTVNARHIFYDLDNYFTIDSRAVECTVQEALAKCMSENKDLKNIYNVKSDIESKNTLYFVEENVTTSIFSIIKRWGIGELIRDNFNIEIRNDVTYSKGYEIRYKKNMTGLVIEENVEDVITKIYPVGYDGLKLPEKFIEVSNIEDPPPHDIVKKVTFDDVTDITNLRIEAKRYAEKISEPFKNISCNMLEIYGSDTYSKFKNIDRINVGDICRVIHEDKNVDIYMKCSYIERDLINFSNNKVELGSLKEILDKKPDYSNIYSKIEEVKPTLYFYQNNEEITFKEEVYEPICRFQLSLVSNTHLKMYVYISGVSNLEDSILDIELRVNNGLYLNPKQKLKIGDNVIGIPIAIPALQSSESYNITVNARCISGEFEVNKNDIQVFAECIGGTGGASSDNPFIQVEDIIDSENLISSDMGDTIIELQSQIPINVNVSEYIYFDIYNTIKDNINKSAYVIALTEVE